MTGYLIGAAWGVGSVIIAYLGHLHVAAVHDREATFRNTPQHARHQRGEGQNVRAVNQFHNGAMHHD